MSSYPSLDAAHDALIGSGTLVPLALGGDEERRWMDCDLASIAENRLGERIDALSLDEPTRVRWTATLEEPQPSPSKRKYDSSYWIVRRGERVGSISIARFCLGSTVPVYSVYVRPSYRRMGIMSETLRAVHAELARNELDLQLDTSWTWQSSVRFYLGLGFWLRSWKRELSFVWRANSPAAIISVGENDASVSVRDERGIHLLASAQRQGEVLSRHDEEPHIPDSLRHLAYDARSTLALAIALQGWPLIRPGDCWSEARHSDMVQPEALAERIVVWEAWAADHGWRVETPRIPGLEYLSWEEIG